MKLQTKQASHINTNFERRIGNFQEAVEQNIPDNWTRKRILSYLHKIRKLVPKALETKDEVNKNFWGWVIGTLAIGAIIGFGLATFIFLFLGYR